MSSNLQFAEIRPNHLFDLFNTGKADPKQVQEEAVQMEIDAKKGVYDNAAEAIQHAEQLYNIAYAYLEAKQQANQENPEGRKSAIDSLMRRLFFGQFK